MKLIRKKDGTILADFKGLDGSRLQLMVVNLLGKLKAGEAAEILMDDPDTSEPILMALREQGCKILLNGTEGSAIRIKFRK